MHTHTHIISPPPQTIYTHTQALQEEEEKGPGTHCEHMRWGLHSNWLCCHIIVIICWFCRTCNHGWYTAKEYIVSDYSCFLGSPGTCAPSPFCMGTSLPPPHPKHRNIIIISHTHMDILSDLSFYVHVRYHGCIRTYVKDGAKDKGWTDDGRWWTVYEVDWSWRDDWPQ